jgi:hypothetical protein
MGSTPLRPSLHAAGSCGYVATCRGSGIPYSVERSNGRDETARRKRKLGNLDATISEHAAILAGRGVNARRLSQKSSSLPAIAA